MPHSYDLQIADVRIRMENDLPLLQEQEFDPFLIPFDRPDVLCRFEPVELLPPLPEKVLTETINYRVCQTEKGEIVRSFFNGEKDPVPYALASYEQAGKMIRVFYTEKGAAYLNQLSNCVYCMGLEGVMMRQQRVCFHAALIRSSFGGILFSGPSGIGKSTQAELWCSTRQAELLNGDRPILGMKNGKFRGYGSPYAGSSRCYVQDSVPISAVVLLNQAPDNQIERVPVFEAAMELYGQMTVNLWDPEFPPFAFDRAAAMAEQLPVYRLSCTKDERAVSCLSEQLRKDLT